MSVNISELIYSIAAVLCAGLLSFALTPMVRVLAYKINAIDIPKDGRRMHDHPIPRIGGLAIFLSFIITILVFCEPSNTVAAILIGGAILVAIGIVDDVKPIKAWIKLIFQIAAALVPVALGIRINFIRFFADMPIGLEKYNLDIVFTVIWIVGLTNAVNLIDGLDGLSCGVSAICSISVCAVALINGEWQFALITAILVGACLGFLPFNSNPAKIFMGDTGALFLGYTMSVLSISGLFKINTVISFIVPLSIFGLPLFDTAFAFARRVLRGRSPFSADRGHLHHRLMDMGFGQKHSVRMLYAICGILGIAAVMFTNPELYRAAAMVIVALAIFVLEFIILRRPSSRIHTGICDDETEQNKENETNEKTEEK